MNNVSLNLLLIKTLSYNNVQLIFIQNHALTKVPIFLISNVTLQANNFKYESKRNPQINI